MQTSEEKYRKLMHRTLFIVTGTISCKTSKLVMFDNVKKYVGGIM